MDGEEFDRLTEEPELFCGLTEQDLTFAVATLGVKVGLGASGFGSLGDPSYPYLQTWRSGPGLA